jgi:demethylmenaquinone methyltransferase/2-methoxy-6-polyprenyl-1,4-benzoquinol methylase
MTRANDLKLTIETARTGGSPDAESGEAMSPSRNHVWEMFDRIARRYDLLNHLLSVNRDRRWRHLVAQQLAPNNDQRVLDLATGTADQLLALCDSGRVKSGVGIDLADKMLAIGRKKIAARHLSGKLTLQRGDAEKIPFDDASFDAVTIAFGIRNMTDVPGTLREMRRVLCEDGRVLILEFSWPRNPVIRSGHQFYLRYVLPRIGSAISGDSAAYRYLDRTMESFPHGDAFCRLLGDAGFKSIQALPLTFGIATIYQGIK